ncbi:MAG: VOC family protein [Saprospiraceae bacterium]|nr:VOC family protein [Saprospiraceae bacterium]
MSFIGLSPMFTTNKLVETIEFYTQTLGFTCESYEAEWGWAALQKNGVHIMFNTPNAHLPFEKPQWTGSLYFYTDDVEKLWNQLKSYPHICYPLQAFDYGMREFAIYDNNGYLLKFGQSVDANS